MAAETTVVIPVRNGATTISDQLRALDTQHGNADFDIVVVDNGSTDDTISVIDDARSWLTHDLRVVRAENRAGPSHARNHGAQSSDSRYVLFCDADDVVGPRWVRGHLDALADHDLSTGPLAWSGPISPPVEASREPSRFLDQAPWAGSGNMGITRSTFMAAGGFDEEVRFAEDVEFCLRLQLSGATLGWSDNATLEVREPRSRRALVRQRYRWGQADVAVYARHRSNGLGRPTFRQQLALWRLVAGLTRRLGSADARTRWLQKSAHAAGRLRGSIRHRTLLL